MTKDGSPQAPKAPLQHPSENAGKRDRLPPGQELVEDFPVLDLGIRPPFDQASWRLEIAGAVERPLVLTWEEFRALPRVGQTSDFHCVTTWSKFNVQWNGVPFAEILRMVKPLSGATHVIQECADGYDTNLPLAELLGGDILLADELQGQPLPLEHGGPLRLLVPHLYAWKSAKFLRRLLFLEQDRPGYWEQRGYHNRGNPWDEERHG
ncbi:MAG: sulfite oxidase-like oxidoreductase [Deltaproteobacteria bacterium]|nr:sulfite oxidase-like oxidoreductase [Deltaproteobacteria bacterium]